MIHVEKRVTKRRRILFFKDFEANGGRAARKDKAFIQGRGCISKLLKVLKMR